MRILFLDDEIERQALYQFRHPTDVVVFATNYRTAVEAFEKEARFDVADLDYQLNDIVVEGDCVLEKTGMNVVNFIITVLPAPKRPKKIVCHSLSAFNRLAMVKALAGAGISALEAPFR